MRRDEKRRNGYKVLDIITKIVQQCRERYRKHETTLPIKFAENDLYRYLVTEMLDSKLHAISKFSWWLEDEGLSVKDLAIGGAGYTTDRAISLLDAHRGHVEFLARTLPAVGRERGASVRPTGPPVMVVRPDATSWLEARAQAALRLCKIKGLVRERVDEVNELGETPFMRASNEGDSLEALQLLIDARADVDAVNQLRSGATALFLATQRGNVSRIRELHSLGASLESLANGIQRPLMIAASHGLSETAMLLVQLRADVNRRAVYRQSALHPALASGPGSGHSDTAKVLRALGAK